MIVRLLIRHALNKFINVLYVLSFFGLFLLRHTTGVLNYHPTAEELSRGLAYRPNEKWGWQMRKEKSIRLLTLGGSNTAYFYGTTYPAFLIESIHRLYNATELHVSIRNEGIAGTGPTMKNFDFFAEPPSTWPNVVSLEFAINTDNQWIEAVRVDQLIHYLNNKWASKNLPSPDYLLIELFRIQQYYPYTTFGDWAKVGYNASKEVLDSTGGDRLTPVTMDPQNDGFNRGTRGGPVLMTLARFYGYPVLSSADSMFPAFTRYYATFANTSIWPYFQVTSGGRYIF